MLSPKRVKHRKQHRGRRRGNSRGQLHVQFGDYGLKSLECGWLTNRQIEAARVAMTRKIKRGGKVWINVFPDKPITKKPAETRMGSGKGSPEGWVAVVKPGRVMFELGRRVRAAGARSDPPGGAQASGQVQVRAARGLTMKASEIRDLDDSELTKRLAELRKEVFGLRFSNATGELDNTAGTRPRQARPRAGADRRARAGARGGPATATERYTTGRTDRNG